MQGVIYQYTSPSGKMYVGQTLMEQRKRMYKHKFEALTKKVNTPFAKAIRKYGWETIKATYKVVETIEANNKTELKQKLTERENFYITEFNTFVPNGYNTCFTNQRKLPEYENKELMYEKISKSLKGKYINEQNPNSRPIVNYETLEKYPSISEASRQTGICVQEICGVLKSKHLTAGGFRWCYLNNDGSIDTSNLREINRNVIPVYCKELDMTFSSCYEASKYIGKPQGKSNIRIACMNHRKRYGYTWEYINK